jgi:hypothetical protein
MGSTKQIVRLVSLTVAALAVVVVMLSREAHADWPEHTITIIVPFPAGGANDLLGRLMAAELAPKLGQDVIVDNRVGAVGNIGLSAAARAPADGSGCSGNQRSLPQRHGLYDWGSSKRFKIASHVSRRFKIDALEERARLHNLLTNESPCLIDALNHRYEQRCVEF